MLPPLRATFPAAANQVIIEMQWACTWSPVELCDAGALQEYDGGYGLAVDQSLKVAPANKDRRRGVVKNMTNRGW